MARPNDLYLALVADLRRQIEASFRGAELIPSERILADTYRVAQGTVHRALKTLAAEGLVQAVPQVGWVRRASREKIPGSAELPVLGLITQRRRSDWRVTPALEGIVQAAAARKLNVVEYASQYHWSPTPARKRLDLRHVPWNSFDVGLLVDVDDTRTLQSALLKRRKVIVVDHDATTCGLTSVVYPNAEAGELAARILLDAGHRHFAIMEEVNDAEWWCDEAWLTRRHAFERAATSLGGVIKPEWRVPLARSGWNRQPLTSEPFVRWSKLKPELRPTALFLPDSGFLEQSYRELREAGFRVPQDLSILAITVEAQSVFDGLRISQVRLDTAALIRRTIDVAVDQFHAKCTLPRNGRPERHVASLPVFAPGDSILSIKRLH